VYISLFLFVPTAILWLASNPSFFSLAALTLLVPIYAAIIVSVIILVVAVVLLGFVLALQTFVNWVMEKRSGKLSQGTQDQLMQLKSAAQEGQRRVVRSNAFINLLVKINPATNDIFERTARFLEHPSSLQETVFEQIYKQYPRPPADEQNLPSADGYDLYGFRSCSRTDRTTARNPVGAIRKQIDGPYILARDLRHKDIVQRVDNVIRIIASYPILDTNPTIRTCWRSWHCIARVSNPHALHLSGVWQYGMSEDEESITAQQLQGYMDQKEYRNLKICLAHFRSKEWSISNAGTMQTICERVNRG
jgi:hypothetical protein